MPNASPRRGHLYETDAAHRDRTTRSVVQVDSIGGGVRRRVHRPDTADADSLAASHRRAVHAGPPCPRRHALALRLQRGDVSRGSPAARHANSNRDRLDMGRRPVRLEPRLGGLEAASQRQRIARSLHDGYVQGLAGVNLRLATSRELLGRGQNEEAFVALTELQADVNREHDELRAYIRSLADLEPPLAPPTLGEGTRFPIRAHFDGSLLLREHVLQIML